MGDVLIDGEAMRDAASIMGDITINGTVHGDVSAVMGDVKLGRRRSWTAMSRPWAAR